jgi:hypothetical protein
MLCLFRHGCRTGHKTGCTLTKSDDQTIGPDAINLPGQYIESQVYTGSIRASYAGNWTIQAYLVDAEGHESNVVTKSILVQNTEIYILNSLESYN